MRSIQRASQLRIWLLVVLLFWLVAQFTKPLVGSGRPAVASLDSIGITVSDIDRSVDFFSKVLSCLKRKAA